MIRNVINVILIEPISFVAVIDWVTSSVENVLLLAPTN